MRTVSVLCCVVAVANAAQWDMIGDIDGKAVDDRSGYSDGANADDGLGQSVAMLSSPPLNRVHFELFNESGCSAPGFKTAVIGPAPETDTASCEAANGYCQECE